MFVFFVLQRLPVFLFFPRCFQKLSLSEPLKMGIVWWKVDKHGHSDWLQGRKHKVTVQLRLFLNIDTVMLTLTLSQTSPGFYVPVIWKHCKKKRNCSKQAISPFPKVFFTYFEKFLKFSSNLNLSSASSSVWKSKICLFEKGLNNFVFNPFPHNDTFWRPWETSLLKHCGKRRNC